MWEVIRGWGREVGVNPATMVHARFILTFQNFHALYTPIKGAVCPRIPNRLPKSYAKESRKYFLHIFHLLVRCFPP